MLVSLLKLTMKVTVKKLGLVQEENEASTLARAS